MSIFLKNDQDNINGKTGGSGAGENNIGCLKPAAGFGIVFFAVVFFCSNVFAQHLEKLKTFLLKGDYQGCIKEGEKLLVNAAYYADMDELYYILGLSYLKEGNILRASDIFEIIINEYTNSRFRQEAQMGLGDTYFLKEDYDNARREYTGVLVDSPRTKLKAALFYRMSQVEIKKGNINEAEVYLEKLKEECPLSIEAGMGKDEGLSNLFYTVQVGAFSSRENAVNLMNKLKGISYEAYMEESVTEEKVTYRVRVGRTSSRREAEDIERKLSMEGFPTKIFP